MIDLACAHVSELGGLAPRTSYARVTVNGRFYGFMGVFERIAKDYVKDRGWDHEGIQPLGYLYKGSDLIGWRDAFLGTNVDELVDRMINSLLVVK